MSMKDVSLKKRLNQHVVQFKYYLVRHTKADVIHQLVATRWILASLTRGGSSV
jgi:hypothetical protein